MRKTKIICTLGPASESEDVIRKLMLAGMNVVRMNFSHGTHEEHKGRVDTFKKVREELGMPIPLLLDTKGPEIRIGQFDGGKVEIVQGQEFTLTTKEIMGNKDMCSISYSGLAKDVHEGVKILIDDGLIELVVKHVTKTDIVCEVKNGGFLSDRKNVNVHGAVINLPALTDKDISDIKFGIENGFDIIAASFVRKPEDVLEIRKVLSENGGSDLMIVAKIENPQGVENIDDIIRVADGIMVARGDLGVAIPIEDVPIVQKMLIEKSYRAGKPVITATQMLDSMIRNPRPTRAEATDIANAIYDGTSAIMLSGETAAGKYPIDSVTTMARIAERAEKSIDYKQRFSRKPFDMLVNVTNAISHATCTTAHDLGAVAIITVTTSGSTARMVSKFRPACPIITVTTNKRVQRQLNLSWGVIPLHSDKDEQTTQPFDMGIDAAVESELITNGDLVVLTGGLPAGVSGTTNTLRVHIVGDVLAEGTGIGGGTVTGVLCVAKNTEAAIRSFHDGNILVVPKTSNELLPIMKKASALIVEESGASSHAATVGLALDIPVIIGVKNATKALKHGTVVTIDSKKGLIYSGVAKH